MNKNEKIVVIASATYLVLAGAALVVENRIHRKKTTIEIDAETQREIDAIHKAGDAVRQRMNSGKRYRSIAHVMDDFAFERIAARIEE